MHGGNNARVSLPVLRSGIAPIDERLGGLAPGQAHLISGATGSGKTAIGLACVGAALTEGQSAAILTQDHPHELLAQAVDLGLDLGPPATAGQLAILCYKPDFAARFGRALSAEPMLEELVRLMGPRAPDRLVIDSVAPFLEGSASAAGMAALANLVERIGATTLVTYPGDVRDHYDRRLEPLVRRCAAVLHVSAYGEGIGRMDVVKARRRLWSDAPAFFAIRPGRGVVALDGSTDGGDWGVAGRIRSQVLVFEGADGLPEDYLAALDGVYAVAMQGKLNAAVLEFVPPDVGAMLVAARWDALADATRFLRYLRHFGIRAPVILVIRGEVRSSDRARALLVGFDDVIADAAGPDEFIARVTAVVRRGRSTLTPVMAAEEDASWMGASDGRLAVVLDEMRFRVAVEAAANGNAGQVFSVLLLTPVEGELETLAGLAARTMRGGSGDVVGVVGDRVAVYLPRTRRTDVTPFLRRVCDAWRRAGRSELRVVQLAYPVDSERLRNDLRLPAPSVHTPLPE